MPPDHENREARQQEILAILDSHRVTSQGSSWSGCARGGSRPPSRASAATCGISGWGGSAAGYARPVEREESDPGVAEVARFLRGVKPAGPHLSVVLTTSGTAQAVGLAIDRAGWPELVGTMAGDDTVFAATASAADQKSFIRRLESFLKEG